MSAFGENYTKNDLLDNIQEYFAEGGTLEGMFDVLKYVFEYGRGPFDELQEKLAVANKMNETNYNKYCEVLKENQQLKEEKVTFELAFTLTKQKLEEIEKEITEHLDFCKNDSGGAYNTCNIVIKHYEKLLSIIERGDISE